MTNLKGAAARISKRHKRFASKLSAADKGLLRGAKGWFWHAVVVGNDIIVRGALATWFGGPADTEDNGETSSGVNTKDTPDIIGCALPLPGFGIKSLVGSPLPKLPWFTTVRVVTPYGQISDCSLIDLGPSRYTNHAIDLTTQAFVKLGGDLDFGLLSVDYQILGGAGFLK